jgi:hypothetical protein
LGQPWRGCCRRDDGRRLSWQRTSAHLPGPEGSKAAAPRNWENPSKPRSHSHCFQGAPNPRSHPACLQHGLLASAQRQRQRHSC